MSIERSLHYAGFCDDDCPWCASEPPDPDEGQCCCECGELLFEGDRHGLCPECQPPDQSREDLRRMSDLFDLAEGPEIDALRQAGCWRAFWLAGDYWALPSGVCVTQAEALAWLWREQAREQASRDAKKDTGASEGG